MIGWLGVVIGMFVFAYAARDSDMFWVPAVLGVVALVIGFAGQRTPVDPRVLQSQAWKETEAMDTIFWVLFMVGVGGLISAGVIKFDEVVAWLASFR